MAVSEDNYGPLAISGGIKIAFFYSLFALLGVIISAWLLKKQKGAAWIILFNLLVFLYCIFGSRLVLGL